MYLNKTNNKYYENEKKNDKECFVSTWFFTEFNKEGEPQKAEKSYYQATNVNYR